MFNDISKPRKQEQLFNAKNEFLMRRLLPLLFILFTQAGTGQPSIQQQDFAEIRLAVEQFFLTQTIRVSGQKIINVGKIDSRLNLAACAQPEPFLPTGSRAWGKTTVGVRCTSPTQWTIYIQVEIKIIADYIVTTTQISQGQQIQTSNLTKLRGDLSYLPSDVVIDETQAIGKTANISLRSGVALRMDSLRNQLAVQQGQAVRLISTGPNFQVATEGQALSNASEGQAVQVRTLSGQVIRGTAKSSGIVEVFN
jgi:flagella basal body P-ring formation protein FlgA